VFRGEVVLDGDDEDVGEACEGATVGVEGGLKAEPRKKPPSW
jgi:hypothetical protein